jgi:hypothetical protein
MNCDRMCGGAAAAVRLLCGAWWMKGEANERSE